MSQNNTYLVNMYAASAQYNLEVSKNYETKKAVNRHSHIKKNLGESLLKKKTQNIFTKIKLTHPYLGQEAFRQILLYRKAGSYEGWAP